MPELEEPLCLCGEKESDHALVAKDTVTGETFNYLHCANCGLERLSPRPVLAAMGRYYPDDYPPHAKAARRQRSVEERIKHLSYLVFYGHPHERQRAVRLFRWPLMLFLAPIRHYGVLAFASPIVRRLFEFGCGTGTDLHEFKDAGWEVFGCEPSARACAMAAESGLAVQHCGAEDAQLPPGLSCAYLKNVFEHLHDPVAVLAKCRAALVSGGLVVLLVPNHASWAARLFGAAWPGYDPPRHLWGFSPQPIRRLLEDCDFRVVSITQVAAVSKFLWSNGIHGGRAPTLKWPRLRRRLAHVLGRSVVLFSIAAAQCGRGDYIRVIAQKR